MIITIDGYFSCDQKDFVPIDNQKNYLVPIYFLE